MKQKEFLFVFLAILLITSIFILNYFTDPYKIVRYNNHPYPNTLPRDLIYPFIEKTKYKQFHTVILGSSQSTVLYGQYFSPKNSFINLAITNINYKIMYEILKKYLSLHSETKTIIIGIEQPLLFINQSEEIKDNSQEHLKNIINLLFSYNSTKKSVQIIMNKCKNFIESRYKTDKTPNKISSYPYIIDLFKKTKYSQNIMDYHYEYLNKIIELAKEHNLEFKFIMLPVQSSALVSLNENNDLKKIINNTKRFLADKNVDFYDMQFANKYTNLSIFSPNNCLWHDRLHPNIYFWDKVAYKILFDETNADKDLYFKINKDNYNQIIEKEEKFLKQYIINHKKELDYYDSIISSKVYIQLWDMPLYKDCKIGLSNENENN